MDRRAFLVASGLLALGPRLAAQAPAGPGKFRVGVTDWNLRLEGDPASASLAKACGFDGVQVILLPFFGRGALETPAEMDYVADLLKELGPQAEKQGVVLGLENTISAKDNVRIMERSQSAAVKTYYDVGNSIKQGFDIIEEIRWLGNDRICEIHLKDNPHYLGEGPINFPAVIKALHDIGFDKWAVLETSCPSDNVQADMTRNLAFIRALIEARA
jgi:L-ribulose-5-phosphate 3-epimerase